MGLRLKPDLDEFYRLARDSKRVPVWVELVEDETTPISALRKFIDRPGGFLLESVIAGERIGRYSFLGTEPFMTFSACGNRMVVRDKKTVREFHGNVVEELKSILSSHRSSAPTGCPGFCGGAVGYFGYDFARQLEDLPRLKADSPYPDVHLMFYDKVYIFDHMKRTVIFLYSADTGMISSDCSRDKTAEIYRETGERLRCMIEDFRSCCTTDSKTVNGVILKEPEHDGTINILSSNFIPGEFCRAVEQAKENIFAGDIFQIVLSQRFHTYSSASSLDLYRVLRYVNPSPYMFYIDCGGFDIIGSSPESHVKLKGDRAVISPIAGTRIRGKNGEEDEALSRELLQDEKEKAEHIMLVDLARNDLGRVCRFGTVQVEELMTVERYSHVMHLVSRVTGRLREEEDALSLLCGTFPAGTVSGAPKIRAMELIAWLEPEPRGPYAGALGYISFHGDMNTALVIRTMLRRGHEVSFQAGAGIVADSDPQKEYEETCSKARAMLRALQIVEGDTGDFDNRQL